MTTAPSKPAPFPRYSGIRSPTPDGCNCRWETINAVSQTGGHLGSSLGVVELTVALHYVFDAPSDPIIFDVSHQVYPHKILTGRRSRMPTLRHQAPKWWMPPEDVIDAADAYDRRNHTRSLVAEGMLEHLALDYEHQRGAQSFHDALQARHRSTAP